MIFVKLCFANFSLESVLCDEMSWIDNRDFLINGTMRYRRQ